MSNEQITADQEKDEISISFTAPWSPALKNMIMVGAGLIVLATWIFEPAELTSPAALLFLSIPVALVIVAVFFVVGRYEITNDSLIIHRLGWTTVFELENLTSAKHDVRSMEGATRTFGGEGGWLTAMVGNRNSERLGDFQAYVTDPELAVMMRFKNGIVVVSPEEPGEFVQTIRKVAGLAAAPDPEEQG